MLCPHHASTACAVCLRGGCGRRLQKEEAAVKKAGAAAAEDAQKAIADMMVQAQAQMAQEAGAVRTRGSRWSATAGWAHRPLCRSSEPRLRCSSASGGTHAGASVVGVVSAGQRGWDLAALRGSGVDAGGRPRVRRELSGCAVAAG